MRSCFEKKKSTLRPEAQTKVRRNVRREICVGSRVEVTY